PGKPLPPQRQQGSTSSDEGKRNSEPRPAWKIGTHPPRNQREKLPDPGNRDLSHLPRGHIPDVSHPNEDRHDPRGAKAANRIATPRYRVKKDGAGKTQPETHGFE